jgi:hypothetical protein
VGTYRGSPFDQHLDNLDGWRVAKVVRAFLERQTPDGYLAAIEPTEQLIGSGDEPALGLAIDLQYLP